MEASQIPNPPQQGRAKATLERILSATEALLADGLFEEITMAQIAAEAGVSVGTIYTRFPSKTEVLPALFERHDAQVGVQVEKLLGELRADPRMGLAQRIEAVVGFSVSYHRRRRGLLRALTMYTWQNPDAIPPEILAERGKQYRAVAELLVGDGRDIGHPDPQTAIPFAMSLVASACKDRILFSELNPTPQRPRSYADFVRELSSNLYLYLSAKKA